MGRRVISRHGQHVFMLIIFRYKRTELMLDPLSIAKTIALDTLKLGQVWLGVASVWPELLMQTLFQANCYYGHTLDKLERHSLSDQSEGLPNLTDLGVTPMPMTDRVRHDVRQRSFIMKRFYLYAISIESRQRPGTTLPTTSSRLERKFPRLFLQHCQ